MEPLVLGGVEQWISVEGERPGRRPVLFVHGGPGAAETPWIRRFLPELPERFAVVSWDQRGAGRSWRSIEPRGALTPDRLVADTVELAEKLAARFGEPPIVVGHSFGAALAALAARDRPDLFRALVAVAPLVNTAENDRIAWERTLALARERGDRRAAADLEEQGPPPYSGPDFFDRYFVLLGWAERFSAEAAGESDFRSRALAALADAPDWDAKARAAHWKAYMESFEILYPQLAAFDLERSVPKLELPVRAVVGRHDAITPPELAERWLERLAAPQKTLAWFERSGHSPHFEEPEKFLGVLEGLVG